MVRLYLETESVLPASLVVTAILSLINRIIPLIPLLFSHYIIEIPKCEKWNYGILIQKYLLSICYFLGGSQI